MRGVDQTKGAPTIHKVPLTNQTDQLTDYAGKILFYSFRNSFLCDPSIHKLFLFFFWCGREKEALAGGAMLWLVVLLGGFGWWFWLVSLVGQWHLLAG